MQWYYQTMMLLVAPRSLHPCVCVKYNRPAWLQGSMAPALSASMSMASPLGDRTNKIASSQLPVPAVYKQQPKGASSGGHQGLRSFQEAACAVPVGESGDEGRDQMTLSHIRHEPARDCAQQDGISKYAHTQAQIPADPMSKPHEEEVTLRLDTAVHFLSISDSAETMENRNQGAELGQSSPDRHHCSSAVHEPVFGITAGSASSIRHATDIVSPGRRVFAAQVTVTRPTTPAIPALALIA